MLKAVAGGGGKGMRLVTEAGELQGALRAARSEAQSSFGDGSVYLERRLERPRHIEVQLLGDRHGTVLPFVERECSIQRRHQKVLEESPSTAVTADQRRALAAAAARVARHVGYTNAGTIEFLLDADGRFYFLEMNTRLQVEHPVTEMVTGVDLVEWQLRIAEGEPLTLDPEALVTPIGHAIEARIYAEDPDDRFLPSPGRVTHLRAASGPGVRDDGGLTAPGDVPIYYDPLVAKLVARARDRAQAIARLARALREYEIEGIKTTIPFFRWLLTNDDYVAARVDTTWLDRVLARRSGQPFWASDEPVADLASIAAAIHASVTRSTPRTGPSPATQAATGWVAAARREALR
jgi:acetyl-CoA carboxylase biotin carboxylase subunit